MARNQPAVPRYWAVLDISTVFGDPDTRISVETDSPCELWIHATVSPPAGVPQHRMRRGAIYEAFTLWVSPQGVWLRQLEAGDSSLHTFIIAGWPQGTTLWYYLDGYQQGRTTISTSILFGSLRTVPNFNPTQALLIAHNIDSPFRRIPSPTFGPSPTITIPAP